jgi:hypothetical protein
MYASSLVSKSQVSIPHKEQARRGSNETNENTSNILM